MSSLVVTIVEDDGRIAADCDIARMKAGQKVLRSGVSELYFMQLRLRVAEDPLLAHMIDVKYVRIGETTRQSVWLDGTPEEVARWPMGFMNAIWQVECKIREAYKGNWKAKEAQKDSTALPW